MAQKYIKSVLLNYLKISKLCMNQIKYGILNWVTHYKLHLIYNWNHKFKTLKLNTEFKIFT
jgi:hypothetical protein